MIAGKHTAKILNYGMSETKAGDPQIYVEFSTKEGNIRWFGGTKSEKQAEITARSLIQMGFKGSEFSDIIKPNQLDENVEYTLAVAEDTYNGKTSLKVKAIYRGGTNLKTIADQNQAKKADGFSAMLVKARAEAGVKAPLKNHAPGAKDVGF